MSDSLPLGGGDSRSLVPVPRRDLSSDPVIESFSLMQDFIDIFSETFEDLDSIKVSEFDELLESYVLSKEDIADSIVNALSANVSTIRDNAFLIKSTNKVSELNRSKRTTSRHSTGSIGRRSSLANTYKSSISFLNQTMKNPLSLVDKLAELPFKAMDKVGGGIKGLAGLLISKVTDRTEEEDSYDSFTDEGSFKEPVYSSGSSDDFFGNFLNLDKPISSEDDLQEQAVLSKIKADNVMFDTFDDPEKSSFGNFLSDQIIGEGDAEEDTKRFNLLEAIMYPLLLIGFLFLVPLLPGIIDAFVNHVIPFLARVGSMVVEALEVLGSIIGNTLFQFIGNLGKYLEGDISLFSLLFGENSLQALLGVNIVEALGLMGGWARFIENMTKFGIPAAILGMKFAPFFGIQPFVGAILFGVAAALAATSIQILLDWFEEAIIRFTDGGAGEFGSAEIVDPTSLVVGNSAFNPDEYMTYIHAGVNVGATLQGLQTSVSSSGSHYMFTGDQLADLNANFSLLERLRPILTGLDQDQYNLLLDEVLGNSVYDDLFGNIGVTDDPNNFRELLSFFGEVYYRFPSAFTENLSGYSLNSSTEDLLNWLSMEDGVLSPESNVTHTQVGDSLQVQEGNPVESYNDSNLNFTYDSVSPSESMEPSNYVINSNYEVAKTNKHAEFHPVGV